MMSMTLKFNQVTRFIFVSWESDTVPQLIFGCIGTAFLAFLMIACPELRRRSLLLLENKSKQTKSVLSQTDYSSLDHKKLNTQQQITSISIYLLYALLHVLVMIIIMAMNFYVICSVIIGATIGFYLFNNDYCPKKNVNSCCESNDTTRKGNFIQQTQGGQ